MLRSWSSPRETTLHGMNCLMLSWQVSYCDLVVYIASDEPRVFVGQGDFPPREADSLEVQALAERFNSSELWAALKRMQG